MSQLIAGGTRSCGALTSLCLVSTLFTPHIFSLWWFCFEPPHCNKPWLLLYSVWWVLVDHRTWDGLGAPVTLASCYDVNIGHLRILARTFNEEPGHLLFFSFLRFMGTNRSAKSDGWWWCYLPLLSLSFLIKIGSNNAHPHFLVCHEVQIKTGCEYVPNSEDMMSMKNNYKSIRSHHTLDIEQTFN